ncbi:precorrin-6y C5,15-methyltransferase (decarboxylating) subunit CbiE [Marinomonas pollencensis]|uniref:Precorrin-6Y C5,15-methyltransferase (Decarboxylating) n=1 Tax=Marinomonas pollencensis TaxID=491954 RepID=A0A3E0DHK8_9GAMM|nr:precorrin-6y C5,15-methyltransferase (decarboxylating) subunit CbiE [Marinomonas pollencensis]REG82214.1 precorrin-6Y C5,15-methyltransferase (decarboxylating) [Marinomonas pollencensis]
MQIHVIGLGVAQYVTLNLQAQSVLSNLTPQDIVLGSPRQHDTLANYRHQAKIEVLPKLSQLAAKFEQWQHQGASQVVVLASGDPLFYGVGAWLERNFAGEASSHTLSFYPNVSSIQAACHRLGMSLQDVHVVSLHGRPLSNLRRSLQANKRLVLLTDQYSQPAQIAAECVAAGLDQSELIVCEALGYEKEQVRHFSVADLLAKSAPSFDPLNVVVVKTSSSNKVQSSVYPSAPGIPDNAFVTDKGDGKGMITKREVRLVILSYLSLQDGDTVWDIGAGCGGVSVELAYWHPNSKVIAIEHHAKRLACLEANQSRFGVTQNLTLVAGRAPAALADLPLPDKVFIGGSDGELSDLMAQVWCCLPLGGRLMVSAVTEDSKYQLMHFSTLREQAEDAEEQSVQLAVAKQDLLAGQRLYRPNLPVTLSLFIKTSTATNIQKDTK